MSDETVSDSGEALGEVEALPTRAPTRREKWSILAVAGVAYLILGAMCLAVLAVYLLSR